MPDPKEVSAAIKQICEEKGIPFESVVSSIEAALAVAYRKEMGMKGKDVRVEFNPNDASMRAYEVHTVVDDELYQTYLQEKEAAEKAGETLPEVDLPMSVKTETGTDVTTGELEPKLRFNPKTHIPFTEAKKESEEIELGDEIRDELEVPGEFGRMAAQTAKQVIIQKLREAERETLFNLYKDRSGQILNGTIQRVDGKFVFVDLGQAIAVMPPSEQIPGEQYRPGQRIKVLLLSIEKTNRGPEIVASRSNADLVAALFRAEVPEIAAGSVEIKGVSREAGSRTKIAVAAVDPNIDPIGSCVGQRGTRVQTIIGELAGEKIDIVHYNDDPVKFIVNALSPAKIVSVTFNETGEQKVAIAEVMEDQFSLAIGRSGQNVRLASRLTGWSIDIVKAGAANATEEKLQEKSSEAAEVTSTTDTAAETTEEKA